MASIRKTRVDRPGSTPGQGASNAVETFDGTVDSPEPVRLDRYLADNLGLLTRSQLKTRLDRAMVNGRVVKLSRMVNGGDVYSLVLKAEESRIEAPENLDLSVLYEDSSVIVVDKPQGMVTHPAQGNWRGTLANGLLGRLTANLRPEVQEKNQAGLQEAPLPPIRAGIVHRLDKDTSGVIIAAKAAGAQEFLSAQFRDRSTKKLYYAIVRGQAPSQSGRLDSWLARDPSNRKRFAPSEEGRGKRAVTDWKVLARKGDYAFLALYPKTGRTHQLRVHCRQLGCPILGDPIYCKKDPRFPDATLMLHAAELWIRVPGETELRCFKARLPERFLLMMDALAFPGLHSL